MKELSLRIKFRLLGAAIIFILLTMAGSTYYSISRIQNMYHIKEQMQELDKHVLNLRSSEKDFIALDNTNSIFFTTGKSDYLKKFENTLFQSYHIIDQLKTNSFLNKSKYDKDIQGLRNRINAYSNAFKDVQIATKEKGFKDFGLIGQMRAAIHNVEDLLQDNNYGKDIRIDMLTLRRHEKDFLLRKDLKYANLFNQTYITVINHLQEIKGSSTEKERLKSKLVQYRKIFNLMVQKYNEIGLKEDDGLMGYLKSQVNQVEPTLNELVNEMNSATDRSINITLILLFTIAFIGMIGIIILNSYLSRYIYKTLGGSPRTLARIIESVSNGNLTIFKDYKKPPSGVLAMVMTMTQKLESIIKEIMDSTNTTVSISHYLNTTSQQINKAASEQTLSIEEISTTMQQFTANIHQNASNAKTTEKASALSQKGFEDVHLQTSRTVEANRNISERINIINEIAKHTNILALNAAVEASRAGEHGKGFTIVASEVRKLAERSTNAAHEIVKLTHESFQLAEVTGSRINEILPEMIKTSQLVKEISAASAEQSGGSDQVNTAIMQIAHLTQENAASAEELEASATQLENHAKHLKGLISYFKV